MVSVFVSGGIVGLKVLNLRERVFLSKDTARVALNFEFDCYLVTLGSSDMGSPLRWGVS